MTAAEKTDLFGLLTTAEDWISGYRSVHPVPEFTDSADCGEVAGTADFTSVSALESAVMDCGRCALATGRLAAVPGEGPRSGARVPVMVVGMTPGTAGGDHGRPFAGNGGMLLDKMLSAIRLSANENCYLTSLAKCAHLHARRPDERELQACSYWLDAQIGLLQPLIILALGGEAAQRLLDTGDGIESLRGTFYGYRGIPLLATYHPDDILADESLKRPAWEDLKLFRSELDRIWHNGSK